MAIGRGCSLFFQEKLDLTNALGFITTAVCWTAKSTWASQDDKTCVSDETTLAVEAGKDDAFDRIALGCGVGADSWAG